MAWHLERRLRDLGFDVKQINSRTMEHLDTEADLHIVAVSDNGITDVMRVVAEKVSRPDAIIAHTSGSMPLVSLEGKKSAVLYPMQTFTREREVDMSRVPVFVDADDDEALEGITEFSRRLSDNVHRADENTRTALHVAAVFSCNYINHLLHITEHLLEKTGFELPLYEPLIRETIDKAFSCGPHHAQTGPARRRDLETLWRHMDMLNATPHARQLYKMMAQQIINIYRQQDE